jgi:hypothetical protein
MKPTTCAKIRQQDEYYCPLCHLRWEVNDTKPGSCAPLEIPVEINSPTTSKNRFRQAKKRANKFRGYR